MGHRREGFLTPWQEQYVKGQKKVDEKRQRIEDFYILKQWDKTLQQIDDVIPWLEKKHKAIPDYAYVIKAFYPRRGKPPQGMKSLEQKLTCPICDAKMTLYVDKNGNVYANVATGGVPKEKRIVLGKLKTQKIKRVCAYYKPLEPAVKSEPRDDD